MLHVTCTPSLIVCHVTCTQIYSPFLVLASCFLFYSSAELSCSVAVVLKCLMTDRRIYYSQMEVAGLKLTKYITVRLHVWNINLNKSSAVGAPAGDISSGRGKTLKDDKPGELNYLLIN